MKTKLLWVFVACLAVAALFNAVTTFAVTPENGTESSSVVNTHPAQTTATPVSIK